VVAGPGAAQTGRHEPWTPRAGETFARAGVEDRVQIVPGSFFDPLPRGGDVYLLSGVLIDWPDREAAAILRRCADAAGPASLVLIAEQRSVEPSAAADENLRILLLVGGQARTPEQFRALIRAAGLKIVSEPDEMAAITLLECAHSAA
jgi:2,7-dihydroxy-5-methyl-1-naphthoate 7-O-methyltransferase